MSGHTASATGHVPHLPIAPPPGGVAAAQWRPHPPGVGALGTYAKTASAAPLVDPDTGEILRVDHRLARAERFQLKAVAGGCLPPEHRTLRCMRVRAQGQQVQVVLSTVYGRARYTGLQTCGSVWACPVCAAKIGERRRLELEQAVQQAKALGLSVYLLTATVPHGLGDCVDTMLDRMMAAWRGTSSTRSGSAWRQSIGLVGTVRALEVTYGANGFHPHFHALVFARGQLAPEQLRCGFLPQWQRACVVAGLPQPSEAHGVDVQDGSYASRYASKWGLECELVKGHQKRGKGPESMTPWDFLRNAATGPKQPFLRLFGVYADAFHGRRQLYWSNGLRDELALSPQELTDEQIASEGITSLDVLLALLTDEQWLAVRRTRSEAALLSRAEESTDALVAFLQSLQGHAAPQGVSDHGPT